MDKYLLSEEGRARFKRMRVSGEPEFEGYEVLAYLYDRGSTSAEELSRKTGIDRAKLIELILTFMHHGLVEGIH